MLLVAICALLSAISTPNALAEVGDKATLPDFEPHTHIGGQTVTKDSLKGKVIYFEYWSINHVDQATYRGNMLLLKDFHRKFGNQGLVIVASHITEPKPAIKEFVETNKLGYAVYQGMEIPQHPFPSELPFAILIGCNGKIVAAGDPTQFYNKISAEVGKAAHGYPILADLKLTKYAKLSKTMLSKGKALDAQITPLRAAADKGDSEAAEICQTFNEWVKDEKSRLEALCDSNPLQAVNEINQFRVTVPSESKDLVAKMAGFQKNPAFKKLKDVQVKIRALQKKQAKGTPVKPAAIESLKKLLTAIQEKSTDAAVTGSCDALNAELDSLSDNVIPKKDD